MHRNAQLSKSIAKLGLLSVNVQGDGNCYFRSLSVCLHGHEQNHASLRQEIAKFINNYSSIIFADISSSANKAIFRQLAADTSTDGKWPGEDVIKATAYCLQREVHIYTASVSSPFVYKPEPPPSTTEPLRLGFYEPGHYRAIIKLAKNAARALDCHPLQTPVSTSSHLNVC